MRRDYRKERKEDIYKAILQLETLEECIDFFQDICAGTELRSIEQRFEVASMLAQHKVYTDIMSKTNASTATISRVKRVFMDGTGMLEESLRRLQESEENKQSE